MFILYLKQDGFQAPVVQRIERLTPNELIEVQFLARAPIQKIITAR